MWHLFVQRRNTYPALCRTYIRQYKPIDDSFGLWKLLRGRVKGWPLSVTSQHKRALYGPILPYIADRLNISIDQTQYITYIVWLSLT